MKTLIYPLAALLVIPTLVALYKTTVVTDRGANSAAVSHDPDLAYWRAANSVTPPKDPQILFLLMAQYSNANLQGEGAEFFFGATEGLRAATDKPAKSALFERHRAAASAARFFFALAASSRLR